MKIESHGLYLASWEHLYLMPGGTPAGLPNQLFSRHPWALILFEHIYCDENGLRGEQYAADLMGWTNSKLFADLASSKFDNILVPIPTGHALDLATVSRDFTTRYGATPANFLSRNDPNLDNLLFCKVRQELLQPFAAKEQLILYDWDTAKIDSAIPETLQLAVNDILSFEAREVHLASDPFTELPPDLASLFSELLEYEREPLRQLKSGRLSQQDYLKHLSRHISKHREVDVFLSEGLDARVSRLLRYRERFGTRGGWKLVQNILAAYKRPAPVRELLELKLELDDKLLNCFRPMASELAPAIVRLTSAIAKIDPRIHAAATGFEMLEAAHSASEPLRDAATYFRGRYRRGRRGKV